jgi:hypothetical protein
MNRFAMMTSIGGKQEGPKLKEILNDFQGRNL